MLTRATAIAGSLTESALGWQATFCQINWLATVVQLSGELGQLDW